MEYFGDVGLSILVCFGIGVAWQGFLITRAIVRADHQASCRLGFVVRAVLEFAASVLIAGLLLGSIVYLFERMFLS
jgi:hypothetical protein